MKVLLTNPINVMEGTPTSFGLIQPIHLMYIASYLEKQGYEVKIFDTVVEKSVKKYLYILKKFNPDVVGIGAVSSTIFTAWDTAELVKKHSDAIVVLGGDHVTFLPGETFYCCPYVDYIVRGEGEYTTADLLRSISGKKKIEKVKGVSYRKDGKIVHNPPRPWIKNLDKLPHPAWHLVDMYKYVQIAGKSGLFVSSRGCSRGCTFCISCRKLGLDWRSRSADSVSDEMIQLAQKYPKLDNVVAIDDNFMWDIKRVKKICDILIKNNYDMPWICQGRADTIVKGGHKLVEKMHKAGCMAIQIGIESPFVDRLKLINKGLNKGEAEKAIDLVNNAGMFVRGTFLFGFEDETKEKMNETFNYAKRSGAGTIQIAIMTPFPGAPYFEKIKHKLNTHDWRRFTVAHQFLDYGIDVEKEINKLYLKFHMSPKFLAVAKKININPAWTFQTFIYAALKSISGNKGDYLYDFTQNKWLTRDEEYWQKYILKTNLIFEETWYHNKPKIDPLQIPYTPKKLESKILKDKIETKEIEKVNWVRIG